MKQFGRYLLSLTPVLIMQVIMTVIFLVVFWLYRLPLKAVLYPLFLCLIVAIIFLIRGYEKYKRKHERLQVLAGLSSELIDQLPEGIDCYQKDYQDIVTSLTGQYRQLKSESFNKYNDMIDYYTTWAHQIKTPIASMKLQLQNDDSNISRQLMGNLNSIERYVEMVLCYLRLDSSDSDYVFKSYKLEDLIKESLKRFSNDFINKKLKLDLADIDYPIITDGKWLQFVLEQILSNSIKYTKKGGISIYMENDVLKISDTGIGIAPEDINRIFQKGFTGYNGRLDNKSSGIGLYLCKRICDKLNIGINVESQVNAGTTISLDMSQRKTIQE